MYRYIFCFLILLISQSGQLQAQFGIGKSLQKKAGSYLKSKLAEKTKEKSESYDTSAFNYSIAYLDKSETAEDKAENQGLVKAANFFLNDENLTALDKARKLYDVGKFNYTINKYFLSETYLVAAKLQYESYEATKEANYIRTIGLLGLLYNQLNQFDKAEKYLQKAMQLWIDFDGEKGAGYYAELNNLSVLKLQQGKFAEAENKLRAFGNYIQESEGEQSLEYCIYLNNLSILYQSAGRIGQALQYNKECVTLAEEVTDQSSSTYLGFLTNKAVLLQENNQIEKAEKVYEKALEIQTSRAKFNRKNDTDYAHMQQNIASLYRLKGEYIKAEEALQTALSIYISKNGEKHLSTASAQSDLGRLYRYLGKLDKSKALLEDAFYTRKNKLNNNHPKVISSKEDLARWYWHNNQFQEAKDLYHDLIESQLKLINEYFPAFSDAEKTKFWDLIKPSFDRYFNFVLTYYQEQPDLLDRLIEYRLATKGVLLNSSTTLSNAIQKEDSPEINSLYQKWIEQKQLMAATFSLSEEAIKEQGLNIDSLRYEINSTEKALYQKSDAFTKSFQSNNTNIDKISSNLDRAVLVEIMQLPLYDKLLLDNNQYVYLIISKNNKPKVLKTTNGKDLETKYYAYYNNVIQNKLDDQYSYQQFWSTVDGKISEYDKVFVSNDGIYNQINLNSIKKPNGNYIIQESNIIYLGHPNDLLKKPTESNGKRSAVLVGNPNFSQKDIASLPGTELEINNISNYLSSTDNIVRLTADDANEANIRAIKQPRILHIASHGFFIKDQTNQPEFLTIRTQHIANNPMLKSGILLSGISDDINNLTNKSFSAENNGVLTAYEAMQLNLSNTDLVVLSACETAQGDVKAGEGVYGLQRSFMIAGAKNLIMSLWKVEDQATQQLMSEFYKNQQTQSKIQAFRAAQLQLLKQYKHPYYWGAFMFYSK